MLVGAVDAASSPPLEGLPFVRRRPSVASKPGPFKRARALLIRFCVFASYSQRFCFKGAAQGGREGEEEKKKNS